VPSEGAGSLEGMGGAAFSGQNVVPEQVHSETPGEPKALGLGVDTAAAAGVHALGGSSFSAAAPSTASLAGRGAKKAPPRPTTIQLRLLATTDLEVYGDPSSIYYPMPTVCRIFHGCMQADGKLLLPEKMRRHKFLLRSCGIVKVGFEDTASRIKVGEWRNTDLFTNVLRYHMPHLVSDVLSLTYAMSVVGGEYELGAPIPRRSKLVRPVAVAQDRVRTMQPAAWTQRMLARLPYNAQVKTWGEVFAGKAPPQPEVATTCFRSVVAFDSQVYWQVSPARFGAKNALFAQNTLWTRTPKRPAANEQVCAPVVTVLNRPAHEQRTLINVDDIAANFEELRKTSRYKPVENVSFRVRYMNTSFTDQMQTLQEADVILASHGAALANLIFARIQTPVIEVFPFSTYPPTRIFFLGGIAMRFYTATHLTLVLVVTSLFSP
jgi:Glycosyltransferase 61